MKEYEIDKDNVIKYKTFLTEAEYITLIEMSVDAYVNGIGDNTDNLGVVPYNPIKAQQMFNRTLLSICIENYDENKYELYFENMIAEQLIDEVNNALEAWKTVEDIMDKSISISVRFNDFLNKVLDILDSKLSDGAQLEKLLKALPKDLNVALDKYRKILTPNTANEEKDNKK